MIIIIGKDLPSPWTRNSDTVDEHDTLLFISSYEMYTSEPLQKINLKIINKK